MNDSFNDAAPNRVSEPALLGVFAKTSCAATSRESLPVAAFGYESEKVRSGAAQANEAIDTHGQVAKAQFGDINSQLAPLAPFTVAEASDLSSLTPQAIRLAIREGRLDSRVVEADSGPNRGRPEHRILPDALFAFCPQAHANWRARLAALAYDAKLTREEDEARERHERIQLENPSRTNYAAACIVHLQAFERFLQTTGALRTYGRALYAVAVSKGEVDLPDWVRQTKGHVSPRSLERWEKLLKQGGPAALDPQWKSVSTSNVERRSELKTFAIGLIAQRPHIRAAKLWEALAAEFGVATSGSKRAVTRWLADWKKENAAEYLRMLNPDKAKGKYQVSFGDRAEEVLRLNQIWETDATKVDLVFKDDPKRYTILSIRDIFSDRTRLMVAESSSGRAHAMLFRSTILEWGIPECARTDQGRDYTSTFMTRLFADLGIEPLTCDAYSGDQKPFVERGFGTFLHDILELLPGYIGHNVVQAQELRSQKTFAQRMKEAKPGDVVEAGMPKAEFEDFLKRWCIAEDHRTRATGRLKGKTPAQAVNEWAAEHPVRRVEHPDALDQLVLPAITRMVGKKGIRESNQVFIAPMLGEIIGRQVEIRRSPEDMGRITVYKDGQFFCIAEDPDLTGVSRAEFAARAHEHQRAAIRQEKAIQREAKRLVKPADVAMKVLGNRELNIDPVSTFQVALPVSSDALAAAALAQAAEIVAARNPRPAPAPMSAERQAEIIAQIPAPRVPLEDPSDRFIRLLNATFMSPEDRAFFNDFVTDPIGARLFEIFHQKQA